MKSLSRLSNFTVYLHQKRPFSMSVYDSDYLRNSVLLTHFIGTLVKEDNSGKYVNYIAESIETSTDKTKWIFNIKKGLTCEDGEEITAQSYAENLFNSLKRYKRIGPILEFEKLKGSEDLKDWNSTSILGIRAEKDMLVLEFNHPPEQLLERLTDQYFGYLCKANFKADNFTWKDKLYVVSSGPFKIDKVESEFEVLAKRRADFLLSEISEVESVRFKITKDIEEIKSSNSYAQLTNVIPKIKGMTLVEGVPTFTVNLSIPSEDSNLFKNKKIRRAIFRRLYMKKNKSPFKDIGTIPSNSFFPLVQKNYFEALLSKKNDNKARLKKRSTAVLSISSSITGESREYILSMLKEIGAELNFDMEIYRSKKHGKVTESNPKPYDLRVTSIDLDSVPYFSLVDMIFCSKLGARYPDPSGKMCRFVRQHLNNVSGPLTEEQVLKFHSIVVEDSTILPISHRSLSYLYSDNIDLESVSSSGLWPRVDLLRFH